MSNHDRQTPELFDTSKLTDTPEHWAAFAERIAQRTAQPPSGIEWLARSRAGWIGAMAVLAASILVLIATSPEETPGATTEWTLALVPQDGAARTVLLSEGPPRLESLLFSFRRDAR